MSPHPSLSAPPFKVEPIKPVPTMGPYVPCWCGSGRKYKWCHFRRDLQAPVNIFQVEQKMLEDLQAGYCSHPDPSADPCSSTIIKSHTVQKNGGLSAIAESGHVLTVKPTMKAMIDSEGTPGPRSIGVNKASVFPGFCGKHDDELFKPIESKSVSLNKDTAFLFAYRAMAYELFAKIAQLKGSETQREMDKGQPFAIQAAIQVHMAGVIAGIKLGLRDMEGWKAQFDQRLLSGERGDFHYLAVRFAEVLPIVACSAFHPEYDLKGQPLQRLGRDADFDHIALTVTAFEGQTLAVFGWIGDNSTAQALAASFVDVEDDRKADALIRLLFVHSDNLFLRPSWWNGLPGSVHDGFNHMTQSGTTMRLRTGREIADSRISVCSTPAVELVQE